MPLSREKSIIQCQVKLKLRPAQVRRFERWLWHLTAVHNWAVKLVEADACNRIFRSSYDVESRLVGHSQRLGIPARTIEAAARVAVDSWRARFAKRSGRPKLKGRRNRLNSIPFRDRLTVRQSGRVALPVFGVVKFHKQDIPAGVIKCGRVIRRASGWYLCLFIAAEPRTIQHVADGLVGIDPGFASLVTLSSGEKIDRPVELQRTALRLGQAQRGNRRRLTARLKERESNQRKDRNHKLSRRLVSENALIAWSKDSHRGMARIGFGKSVAGAAHGQLRQMLAYKCRSGGREFVEVSNRYSTMTCSTCGQRTGPHGRAGLRVRQWSCLACGTPHDRDVNAAIVTLHAALGTSVEGSPSAVSGIAS